MDSIPCMLYLYIFPSFPCVFPSVRLHPSTAYGPMDLIFAMQIDLGCASVIFGNPRSKVKVKNPPKTAFSGPILVTGAISRTIQDQEGSGGVPLAACQQILATCQKLEYDGRPPSDGFPSIGKLPV